MPRVTKKQLEFIIGQMADTIISLQKSFNNVQDDLEKLNGKPRLKILIQPKQDLIDYYYNKLCRHDD